MIYNKKFLIITAHPDDLESGCGGLVAKVKQHGGSVTNLILVQPSAEVHPHRSQEIVENKLKASREILGFDTIIYDTPLHSNGRPNLTLTNNLISFVESCIDDHHILISHWSEDHHQDHRVCNEVATSIARKNFEQFWCIDHTPYNQTYRNFNCNQFVDITDFVDIKLQALNCYKSYFEKSQIDTIMNYNKYRGSKIGENKVAETFSIMYNKI